MRRSFAFDEQRVARAHGDVAEAARAVGVGEVLLRRADLVEVLVVLVDDEGQDAEHADARGDPVGQVELHAACSAC